MNHSINAGILPRQTIDAAIVLEFARKNGFPGAEIIYWDQNNPEYGYESLTELVEDCQGVPVTLGISLNAPAMIASREWIEGEDELGPVILQENDHNGGTPMNNQELTEIVWDTAYHALFSFFRNYMRSDQEIIDQTNALARTLYALRGYTVRAGYRFDRATHPHEVESWRGACEAQILLTETDPQDALDEIEENS